MTKNFAPCPPSQSRIRYCYIWYRGWWVGRCLTTLVYHRPVRSGWAGVSLASQITPGEGGLWIDMKLEGCLVLQPFSLLRSYLEEALSCPLHGFLAASTNHCTATRNKKVDAKTPWTGVVVCMQITLPFYITNIPRWEVAEVETFVFHHTATPKRTQAKQIWYYSPNKLIALVYYIILRRPWQLLTSRESFLSDEEYIWC